MTDSLDPEGRKRGELVGEFVRIFQRGRMWYANFQLDGKQHRPKLRTASKKEAMKRARRLEAKILDGQHHTPVKTARIADGVAAYMRYLVTEGRAKKTIVKYTKVFERVAELAAARHATRLDAINLAFVDAYRHLRKTDDRCGLKTIFTETVIIKQLLTFAASRNLLASHNLKDLRIVKPKPTPQPCWSLGQVQQILAAAVDDPYAPLYGILAATGLRISEAKFLTWKDVDIEKSVLHIRPKSVGDDQDWKPKSGDQRVVPLATASKALLAGLSRRSRWVFTAPKSPFNPKGDRHIDERRVLAHLKNILRRLNLPGHLHTFRHSFISHALTMGTPEAVVRQWVGHVDAQVLKLYTHIADSQSKNFMNRLFESEHPKSQVGNNGKRADAANPEERNTPDQEGAAENSGDSED